MAAANDRLFTPETPRRARQDEQPDGMDVTSSTTAEAGASPKQSLESLYVLGGVATTAGFKPLIEKTIRDERGESESRARARDSARKRDREWYLRQRSEEER